VGFFFRSKKDGEISRLGWGMWIYLFDTARRQSWRPFRLDAGNPYAVKDGMENGRWKEISKAIASVSSGPK
jgi:hypothetical protein